MCLKILYARACSFKDDLLTLIIFRTDWDNPLSFPNFQMLLSCCFTDSNTMRAYTLCTYFKGTHTMKSNTGWLLRSPFIKKVIGIIYIFINKISEVLYLNIDSKFQSPTLPIILILFWHFEPRSSTSYTYTAFYFTLLFFSSRTITHC